jgi:protein TonB
MSPINSLAYRVNQRPLVTAFVISFALHAAVLAVRFVDPDELRRMTDNTLEIVLVNARSNTRPLAPQALAQAHLDGGGGSDSGRIASPLPDMNARLDGAALNVAARRLQQAEAEQRRRLALIKAAPNFTATQEKKEGADNATQDEMKSQLARLQAEISQRISDYQKRPRRHHFMPSTSEYRFARYVEDWRAWVEQVGNEHYPAQARGRVYGDLRMTVVLRRDGSVAQAVIEKGSGSRLLDRAARHIVALAAPFAPFPPDIARDTDLLEITRTWQFTHGQFSTKNTGMSSRPGNSGNVRP